MLDNIKKVLIKPDHTIKNVIERLQKNKQAIGVVISDSYELLGVITDYDIRNSILNNLKNSDTVQKWLQIKAKDKWRPRPIKALNTATNDEIIKIMEEHSLAYLPIVDSNNKLINLITRIPTHADVQAVVMAGGFGKRLMPLTANDPKPMLSIGGVPLLERTISHLSKFNIKDLVISLHYKPEKITDYFEDGKKFGMNINYVKEDYPLGTAGALRLLKNIHSDHVIVANGDILTDINYSSMIDFHKNKNADLTVGLIQQEVYIPYGVIGLDDSSVTSVKEKPTFTFMANAGIYILKSSMIKYIPENQKYDMTNLVEKFIKEKKKIEGYPIMENWIDIGDIEQYKKANEEASKQTEADE